MRVLIVDDDAAIRRIVSHVLKAHGHEVLQAADGPAAEAAVAGRHADVILMDVQLGQEDGIALAQRLLATHENPPGLVFVTGASQRDSAVRMEALAPAAIVYKPFDPLTLPAMLDRLFG